MAAVRLAVTGMTCGHCRGRVEEALQAVRGVYAVAVDLDAGSAEVDFNEAEASAEALTAAVEAVGYGASVA
jgi:copper ion binding protein